MKINMTKQVPAQVPVEVKTLEIGIRSWCGQFESRISTQDGQEIVHHYGSAPDFMSNICIGDYLVLNIDLDTGQIINWKPPTAEELQDFIGAATDGEGQA